jgi:hypothetical protein
MMIRHAAVLCALLGPCAAAGAAPFQIEDVASARNVAVAQLKPSTIAFSDKPDAAAAANLDLVPFADWAVKHPTEKKFLTLFPSYTEPTVTKTQGDNSDTGKTDTSKTEAGKTEASKTGSGGPKPVVQKLYMYVAQARFALDRAPASLDLPHDVTIGFLQRIDPAIKHEAIAAADVAPFTGEAGTGNRNPDRQWCTGRTTSICIQSTYKLEGKIPLGIMLVNKLRETAKKISDHIDFQSEFSALAPSEIDDAGLRQLTGLDTPVAGVLEQDIFHVNQIMKFGKFLAVFQNDPTDPGKTVVTAFMTLAIDASVFDKKKDFEKVPVLRNLVPAEVLMGRSSFNSGNSISAGLPQYARNEIKTVAGMLADGVAAK